jgi:hypothetical protein
MINTTVLDECEVTIPGQWARKDSGDVYNFSTDKMELRDERLFKELYIRPASPPTGHTTTHPTGQMRQLSYALSIEGDYCGIVLSEDGAEDEFIIRSITKNEDGSASMEWEDRVGARIRFTRPSSTHA